MHVIDVDMDLAVVVAAEAADATPSKLGDRFGGWPPDGSAKAAVAVAERAGVGAAEVVGFVTTCPGGHGGRC